MLGVGVKPLGKMLPGIGETGGVIVMNPGMETRKRLSRRTISQILNFNRGVPCF